MATKPPEVIEKAENMYVPSQNFLTALVQTFPALFEHIKSRFVLMDLQKLSSVLKSALSIPVQGEVSPFIIPTYPEVTITPLQEATLQAVQVLIKVESSELFISRSCLYKVVTDFTDTF